MKPFLSFLFICLSSHLFAQKFHSRQLEKENLMGRVKLCVDSATYWIDSLFFDRDGYLIVEKNWSPYRKQLSVTTNTYRDTLVVKQIFEHEGKTDIYEYQYDSLNRCTLETKNGEKYVITKYDAQGKVTDYFIYRNEAYMTKHMTIKYDDQNRRLEENYYHEDTLMDVRYIYSYTDSGYAYTIYRYDETVVHVNVSRNGYSCEYYYRDSISSSTLRNKNERWLNSNGFVDYNREELNTKAGEERATQTGTFVSYTYYQYEY